MKKPLFLIVFFMLLVSFAFGQENYQKAYVVTLQGDTVHGFINYRGWQMNPHHIGFKNTLNGKKVIYKPLAIKSFYVHEELYQSAIVESRTSTSYFVSNMSTTSKVSTTTDTAFLKVLVSGRKSLFFYKNSEGVENFYIREDGKPVLLVYKKYTKANENDPNSRSYVLENRKFIGQLLTYLQDCPEIASRINNAHYLSKNLVSIFRNYYKCKNETPSTIQESKKINLKFGVFAGAANTKLSLAGNGYSIYDKMKYPQSIDFCGGVVIDIVFPWSLREWSLYNEIEYTSFTVNSQLNMAPVGYYTDHSANFGYSSVSINNLARFTYAIGSISVFVNAGVSNGFLFDFTNHMETIHGSPNSSTPTIVEGDFITPSALGKTDLAFLAGAGLIYKDLYLEFRYEARHVNFNDGWYSAKVRRPSIRVSYLF